MLLTNLRPKYFHIALCVNNVFFADMESEELGFWNDLGPDFVYSEGIIPVAFFMNIFDIFL